MSRDCWLLEPEVPVPYDVANATMHRLAEHRLAGEVPDTLILLEHPPVFTAGRRATPDQLLWDEAAVQARGGQVRRIDRGGSFTFHGPGQLVGYPIVDLGPRPDVGAYLRALEEAVIRSGEDLGISLERRADVQTGVWRGDEKVCAIGVRLLRTRITLHGFAVNCDVDLSWFDGIVACGLPEHGVTSLARLAGGPVTPSDLRPRVRHHVARQFDLTYRPAPDDVVRTLDSAVDVA